MTIIKQKVLFISGSPRKGNTEYTIRKLYDSFSGSRDIICLREYRIDYCNGCMACIKTSVCSIKDDMDAINQRVLNSDILIIGSPNYFDNVPGMLKTFIDRTNPLYHTKSLKGKKVVFIVFGGGRVKHSERVASGPLAHFAETHGMDVIGSFCFKALEVGETANNPQFQSDVDEILGLVSSAK